MSDVLIAIGIPIQGESQPDENTFAALRATAPGAKVVLLRQRVADAARVLSEDERASSELGSDCELACETSGGNAACFNMLVRSVGADVYILFENGAVPAPGWLERLLETFARISRCGLTGPSTNRSWNEQCVTPAGSGLERGASVADTARAVERRFGAARRSLRPLHSLADFCYAVRREVVMAIGEADEGYNDGTCWEMDYNIRAHRAGFLGVWTCGAFVGRNPVPGTLISNAGDAFEPSKHHYQDKFCGGHLRGKKIDYREHCRGDACPNFAPPDIIQIRMDRQLDRASASNLAPVSLRVQEAPKLEPDPPLVSCIMPTCDRRNFIPDALACFLAQDYPNLELIVVDDGSDSIADLLPNDPRIRYFRLAAKLNTGTKRNFACEQTRGPWIAHWDDDDWYAPNRIRTQLEAMRGTRWQASGTTTMYYLHAEREQAYRYTYRGPGRAWLGALLYTKAAWERHRFESVQIGEDVRFLAHIPVTDRLDLNDPVLTIGMIHSTNTSPKMTTGPYWSPEEPEKIRALLSPTKPTPEPISMPLISCIMPTHNRRAFLPLTLACFDQQTYPNKELIVIDDGSDAVGDLLESHPRVRYKRIPRRLRLGAKRNLACELAQGDLIAHWDDDDWYAPDRLLRQLEPLRADTHDLTGLVGGSMLQMPNGEFWTTTPELHSKMFVGDIHGGTLVYRRALWQSGIRYPDVDLAEDATFIRRATAARKRIARIENAGLFVYLRHQRNTWQFASGRFLDPSAWRKTEAPAGFSQQLLAMYSMASSDSSSHTFSGKETGLCLA